MPVQTRSMIKRAEEERLTQQIDFEEICLLSKGKNERQLRRNIHSLLKEIKDLNKNTKLNSQTIVTKTIELYRLTEDYLKILDGIKARHEEGQQCKLITIGKLVELKYSIKNSRNYNIKQKRMLMDEFDRYTEAVINLFN